MTIREQIHAYLDTLPPHVRVREAAQLLASAAAEIERLETWTIEDPRMLREQIRVADIAYNHLHSEFQKLVTEVNEKSAPNPTANK